MGAVVGSFVGSVVVGVEAGAVAGAGAGAGAIPIVTVPIGAVVCLIAGPYGCRFLRERLGAVQIGALLVPF